MSLAHAFGRRSRRLWLRWPVLANAATVGGLTTAAKLTAAVKIAITARFFGAGDELDAYLTAFLIPSLFGDSVAAAFTPSLIPGLIRVRNTHGETAARNLAKSSAAVALVVMMTLAVLFALGTPWVIRALGESYSVPKLQLTQGLYLGLMVWLPAGALIASWRAILNAHGQFALAAGAPLMTPVLTIAFLYAGAMRWGVWVLVAATLAGILVECALLATAVKRLGYSILPGAWIVTPELRWVSRQFVPLTLSALAGSASALIDQAFAGSLGSGSVSALAYGTKLVAVVAIICAAGLGTAVLPEFSQLAANDDWAALRRKARLYSVLVSAVMIPLTGLLIWLSRPLTRLIFERGAFTSADTELVAAIQRLSLIEAPFAVLFAIFSRLASSVAANRLLAQVAVVALTVNIIADWFFSRWWGIAGLALSTGLVRAVAVGLLVAMLYRREPRLFVRNS